MYRIKSAAENFERIAEEQQLKGVAVNPSTGTAGAETLGSFAATSTQSP
jgi:hypothetical protein